MNVRSLELPKLVDASAREFGLRSPAAHQALVQSAYVTVRYTGPFLVRPALLMRDRLRKRVAAVPNSTVGAAYRGGLALERLFKSLAPDIVASHLKPLNVSRVMAEAALRDQETLTGTTIGSPDIRYRRKEIDDWLIDGAHGRMMDYLRRQRIVAKPGEPEIPVELVDICHHGTLSNLLSLLGIRVNTNLVFYEASRHDPDPHNKIGYVVNHNRLDRLIGDPVLNVLLNREETMRAVEDTLNGPYSTATRIVNGEPERRLEAELHRSIDPASLPPAWRDEEVRIAAKALNLRVLEELGGAVAEAEQASPRGREWLPAEIAVGERGFHEQMRFLLTNDPHLDPAFGAVMSTVVRPSRPGAAYRPPSRRGMQYLMPHPMGHRVRRGHPEFSARPRGFSW